MQTLEQRSMMAAQPVITEFMAKNGVTLTDGFGKNNDWIEITNQGDASIDLIGWHLTDSTNLSKWTFPSFTVAAGQSRVVFASSLDTVDPAFNLHTNFSLSQDGEKLALTKPDLTIVSRYNPDGSNFPTQLADVSYGVGTVYDRSTLVGPHAATKVFVPTNGTLDNNAWTQIAYDDSSWTGGTGGVGFDTGGYEDNSLAPAVVGQWTADSLGASLANGAVVSSWTDSVNGATAYKAGTPTYLSSAINGHSVVHFDAVSGNDLLRIPAASSPMAGKEDFTISLVYRAPVGSGLNSSGNWTNGAGIVDASVNGTQADWGISLTQSSSGRINAGTGATDTTVVSSTNKANNAAHVVVFTRRDNKISLYVDGGDGVVAYGSATARLMTDMVFGGLQTNANYFLGDIAEVSVYDGSMSVNRAYSAASALGAKYNVAIAAPTVTTGATLSGNWTADSLNSLGDNEAVTTWASSVGTRNATAAGSPRLRTGQLNGHSVVHFDPTDGNDNLRVASNQNPLSGVNDFSVAVVFRANSGIGDASNWFNNAGIVDGEVGGVQNDWGLAINGQGQVAAGIGGPDSTLYSTSGNANGVGHVAVYTKIGDAFRLTIDGGEAYEGDAPLNARGSAALVFGSLQTNANYFNGDIAEIRTFNGALDDDAVIALSGQLANTYGISLGAGEYDSLIGLSVRPQMANLATTALVRIPFAVNDPSLVDKLELSTQYDDGFIAYLNGTEIARRNADGTITYTSTASSRRLDGDAVTPEVIDVTAFKGLLLGGGATNVLSFRALNSSLADPDLLLVSQLIGSRATTGTVYMSTPTPGAPNGEGFAGFVPNLTISKPHGVYTSAFDVTVSTTATGVTLIYTLDGSEPSTTNGIVIAPASAAALNSFTVNVNKSTTLRVIGYKNTFLPSAVSTTTYVFPASVLSQGNVQPAGAYWDTQVDPDVVNASQTYTVSQALNALPSFSIVLPDADMFGSNGIYKNPSQKGRQWEREASIEYFDPNNSSLQFQIDAGIRVAGGSIRDTNRPKKSFRLYFRNDYGNGKLDQPLFGATNAQQSFDHLLLRAGNNNTWANEPLQNGDYMRDQFSQELQHAIAGYSNTGRWVQLYINGLYWGVYNVQEDTDAAWAAANFGGDEDNYDVLEPDHNGGMEVQDGTAEAYNNLFTTSDNYVASGGAIDDVEFAALSNLVDIEKLINYQLSTLYRADRDSPVLISNPNSPRNFYAVRRNDIAGKVIFIAYDGELGQDDVNLDRTEINGNFAPSRIFNQLRTNAKFQQLVTDRIYTLFNNGGPLQVITDSVNKPVELYNTLVSKLDIGIVGESARWGDAKRASPFTRDVDWLAAVNWMRGTFMAGRSAKLETQLNADFPASLRKPASYLVNGSASTGGTVAANATLTLNTSASIANDVVYYTIDGTDPRLDTGAVSPSAQVYAGSTITLNVSKTITTRTLNAGVWTATNIAVFTVAGPVGNPLRISEIAFQPTVPAGGTFSGGDYEYLEVVNTGVTPLDISGVSFTGVSFVVPANTILQAGEYAVVVKNAAAFTQAYGSALRVLGQVSSGSLDNSGETLTLTDAGGTIIQSFAYSPTWYPSTAGGGYSLVIRDPSADKLTWSNATAWRASNAIGGSPGVIDQDLPPTVTITPVTPSPRNTTVNSISIVFSEPVTGFDLSKLSFSRAGGANVLTASQTLTSSDGGKTWTLGNLAAVMTLDGFYSLTLSGTGIIDASSKPLVAGATMSFIVDRNAPTLLTSSFSIDGPAPQVRYNFGEAIIASATTPVLTLTPAGGTATTITSYSIVGNSLIFNLPTTLSDGRFTATLATVGVQDAAGNVPTTTGAAVNFGYMPGDVTGDGVVNFDDLVVLAQNYNKTGQTHAKGNIDYSADGNVNFDDLVILAQRYNQSLPPAIVAPVAVVKAPTTTTKGKPTPAVRS